VRSWISSKVNEVVRRNAWHVGAEPRDIFSIQTPSITVWPSRHAKYEANSKKLTSDPYLNSAPPEEIKLKTMKLHCKDEMSGLADRPGGPALEAT